MNLSSHSQTFNLSKTLRNVKLKTLCMSWSETQVYLNVSHCIVFISESKISLALVCANEALDTALAALNNQMKSIITTLRKVPETPYG